MQLANFAGLERLWMVMGARQYVAQAEQNQEDVADYEIRERACLQNASGRYQQFWTKVQTACHDFPENLELQQIDPRDQDIFDDTSIGNADAAHIKVVAKVDAVGRSLDAVGRSLDALMKALQEAEAAQAIENVKLKQEPIWDLQREEAAGTVESRRADLLALTEALFGNS